MIQINDCPKCGCEYSGQIFQPPDYILRKCNHCGFEGNKIIRSDYLINAVFVDTKKMAEAATIAWNESQT
jgi:hypothetical protein